MLGTILLFGSLALLFTLVLRRGRGAPEREARPAKTAVDTWIEDQVALALAKRVGVARDEVLATLRGAPEPELVSSMEQAVSAIQLGYEKLVVPVGAANGPKPQANEAEIHLAITFEGGATAEARRRWAFDELPQAVRDEFARTGASRVYRTWEFPWSDAGAPI